MSGINKFVLALSVSATGIFVSSLAFSAVVAPPTQVPEPGLFGIIAAGAAAVILASRFRNKK